MGKKKISSEPYYPEDIRASHKCSGCEQLHTDLATARKELKFLNRRVDKDGKLLAENEQLKIETIGAYNRGYINGYITGKSCPWNCIR